MQTTTLKEYQDALAKHDWYFSFSDDGAVYRAGLREEQRLKEISRTSDQHMQLWRAWHAYNSNGTNAGKQRPTLELLGLRDVAVEVAQVEPAQPAVDPYIPAATIAVGEAVAPEFTAAAIKLLSTQESAVAYLAHRATDTMRLKAMLWDNQNVIAPGWEIRRYANSPSVNVCSVVNGDVDWAKDFETVEQALAYILSRWW